MLEKEKNYNTFLMSSESIMAVTSTKVGMMDNINQLSSHSAPCHPCSVEDMAIGNVSSSEFLLKIENSAFPFAFLTSKPKRSKAESRKIVFALGLLFSSQFDLRDFRLQLGELGIETACVPVIL